MTSPLDSALALHLAQFPRLYDLDTYDLVEDVQLYRDFARRTGGPVLEIGCGTGRGALPLARDGHEVVGLDIAPAMLDLARAKAIAGGLAERLTLVEADARQFALAREFALALVALNSFMHFVADGDPQRVLRCIHRHLRPDGLLVLDLPNPEPMLLGESGGQIVHEWTRAGEEPGGLVMKLRSQRLDVARQLLELLLMFDEIGPDRQMRRTVLEFELRYFHPREIQSLLRECGFAVENVYGSYYLAPFEPDSPKMILVSRPRAKTSRGSRPAV